MVVGVYRGGVHVALPAPAETAALGHAPASAGELTQLMSLVQSGANAPNGSITPAFEARPV